MLYGPSVLGGVGAGFLGLLAKIKTDCRTELANTFAQTERIKICAALFNINDIYVDDEIGLYCNLPGFLKRCHSLRVTGHKRTINMVEPLTIGTKPNCFAVSQ